MEQISVNTHNEDNDDLDQLANLLNEHNVPTPLSESKEHESSKPVLQSSNSNTINHDFINQLPSSTMQEKISNMQNYIKQLEAKLDIKNTTQNSCSQESYTKTSNGAVSNFKTNPTSKNKVFSSFVSKTKTDSRKIMEASVDIFSGDKSCVSNQSSPSKPDNYNSDSDWEEFNEKTVLSESGQQIKKVLKQQEQTKKCESVYNSQPTKAALKPKINTGGDPSKNLFVGSANSEKKDLSNIIQDPFSGIRIVNPLISSSNMKNKMENRKLVKMSYLASRPSNAELSGDWVTIGVVVSKSEPKLSSKEKQYSIWKLCDLENCDKSVSFFLFNDVFKKLWKTPIASVIGILNANIMPNSEQYKKQQDVSITVDNYLKVMIMGKSKDFGVCTSLTKGGRNCTNIINRRQGEYCTYHVQAAYKKQSGKRAELQTSYSGITPNCYKQKMFKKGTSYIYGGQEYSSTGHTTKPKNQVTISSLEEHDKKVTSGMHTAKISTVKLHKFLKQDRGLKEEVKYDTNNPLEKKNNDKFHEAISIPSVGSLNLVKHLIKKDTTKEAEINDYKKLMPSPSSITGTELLQAHQNKIKTKETIGKVHKTLPILGKGFSFGQEIILSNQTHSDQAKLKAIQKIKSSQNGIEEIDPNNVKNINSTLKQERIRKRVLNQEQTEHEIETNQPVKKKSKLLGNLDLNDPEVQKLLNKKSSHAKLLDSVEIEQQEEYFEILEKKEAMEEKMASIREVDCKAVTCSICRYTAYSLAERCKLKKHQFKWHSAKKRFFKCNNCSKRITSLDKYPVKPCSACNETKFDRVSMLKESKGPKLPGEDLLLRGEERKFINS